MFLRPAAKGQTVLSYSACQAVCVPTQPKRSSQLQKLPTRTYLPTHPHTHKHTVRAISKVTDWRHNVASPLHVCVCLHGVLSTAAQCGACIPFHTHHPTPSPATLLLYELTNPYIPKPTRILLCFSFVLCNIWVCVCVVVFCVLAVVGVVLVVACFSVECCFCLFICC